MNQSFPPPIQHCFLCAQLSGTSIFSDVTTWVRWVSCRLLSTESWRHLLTPFLVAIVSNILNHVGSGAASRCDFLTQMFLSMKCSGRSGSQRSLPARLMFSSVVLSVIVGTLIIVVTHVLRKISNQTAIDHGGRGVCQRKQMVRPSWDVGALPGWIIAYIAKAKHISYSPFNQGAQRDSERVGGSLNGWQAPWTGAQFEITAVASDILSFIFACKAQLHNASRFTGLHVVLLVAFTVYSHHQRRVSLVMFSRQTVSVAVN